MEKYIIKLTEEERASLRHMVSSGKAAARKLTHARILLLADAGPEGPARPDEAIQQALGVGLSTIHRVRQHFVLLSLEAALHPRPSPARPQKVKVQGDVEQALIELACSDPPQGRGRWTLQLLADQLVVLGKLPSVSLETVRLALKKRDTALADQNVVHSSQSGWSVCLPHGGRLADLSAALRSQVPGGLHG